MPKDEFDFDDPMELSGVALATNEDTTDAMCECFIEEFMRMGHNAKQILALFRNPHYLGMNMVLQNRGEQFVRGYIAKVFARWGRPIELRTGVTPVGDISEPRELHASSDGGDLLEATPTLTDPTGGPIPILKL